MPTPATFATSPTRLQRGGAALSVALLLLLTISAASPAVHDWLHLGGTHDANHQCAVVLFASGVTLALALAVTAPRAAWHEEPRRAGARLFLVATRYLRQPERGPPVC